MPSSHAPVDLLPAVYHLQILDGEDVRLRAPADSRDNGVIDGGRAENVEEVTNDGNVGCAMDGNTAAGMSFIQEESMYQDVRTRPDTLSPHEDDGVHSEKEKLSVLDDLVMAEKGHTQDVVQENLASPEQLGPSPAQTYSESERASTANTDVIDSGAEGDDEKEAGFDPTQPTENVDHPAEDEFAPETSDLGLPTRSYAHHTSSPQATSTSLPRTPSWDFTQFPVSNHHPSSLLRPGSKFTGTQQSDRQIYNVDVDILTVNTSQCTLSGYLRICGLTEDTPVLTTYFTGEIIGHNGDLSQPQKYSFKTSNPTWGATGKTDLVHWARFPAWRPFSREAKHDLNFTYPIPSLSNSTTSTNTTETQERNACWQQDYIFMRWKEWFLVPDHTLRSIPGASFEGFYYICFNQLEGRVSGIYFHAKSEKYQQLELQHVFDRGVVPSMEFR